ncbi:type II secretion system F family protein [Actinomarinicola tropica]|uniref:Type II secretion system protein GspF domain-containing protein n=1 Tax=Actinomarinicola tropica TaxID=2789776 RepID=A0A5Q2RM58_9ACTN|nr:hypothetical protein [Actinomarinicola tropica]QGG95651.1 hypothetical protein GH723_11400 [Actinomarinicola tropica]
MTLVVASAAALGTFYLVTATWFGWTGLRPAPHPAHRGRARRVRPDEWLVQAGLADVRTTQFVAATIAVGLAAAAVGGALLGGVAPAVATGILAAGTPFASYRRRRQHRLDLARDAWPHLIEEIRLRVGSLGRSIPQALFEVGERGPVEMRPAFEAAHREWLLTTDFERTTAVLKDRLADPTADVVCETLLVAHALGGSDVGERLAALVEDRILDLQGRKDARAKQAGARFARRFVVLVPVGMALAGMQVGDGRAAYASAAGQAVALVAIGLVAACWWWAGRVMQLPEPERVFS